MCLQAKQFEGADPIRAQKEARQAVASSNDVIIKVLADEAQRAALLPLDPLKLALGQIYVLKVRSNMEEST